MNKRLEAICRWIRPGRGLIDVGTDHAYLPVWLAQNDYPGRLIAADLRAGPLAAARRSAERAGVAYRIEFLLCDGLALCPPEAVDTIVIAGMGGDTICGILDRAEWCMDAAYELLLQPMTKAEVLRYWLINNGFAIAQESLVADSGRVYQLLRVRFTGENTCLRDAELFLGAARDEPLYPLWLKENLARFSASIRAMEQAGERETERLNLYREIYRQMQEGAADD